MSILFSLLAFLIALTVLIAVHEFGHFWVARKLGVKVLRFSIGFGRPLWRKVGKDGTEYVIAWIPLGGYVKMLDEREGEIDADERHLAFNQKSVYARFAIVSAGPMFNLLFAIAAYWLVAVVGVPGLKPFLGDVKPGSPAQLAGLQVDDRITAIDGAPTPTWSAVQFALLKGVMDGGSVDVKVQTDVGQHKAYSLDLSSAIGVLQGGQLSNILGLNLFTLNYPAKIKTVLPDGRGQLAGLKTGDLVVSANGQTIESWYDWVLFVQKRPEEKILVELERDGVIIQKEVIPALVEEDCRRYGRIGVGPSVPEGILEPYIAVDQHSFGAGIGVALDQTWNMSLLMLKMMGKIITGEASVKNISGPIMIAQVAGKTASIGFISFVTFLAIISVSLGVLNLLPIPLLDGGHLFYYLFEIIRGKPLSEEIQLFGQKIGLVMLLMLMSIALYQDVNRLVAPCDTVETVGKKE